MASLLVTSSVTWGHNQGWAEWNGKGVGAGGGIEVIKLAWSHPQRLLEESGLWLGLKGRIWKAGRVGISAGESNQRWEEHWPEVRRSRVSVHLLGDWGQVIFLSGPLSPIRKTRGRLIEDCK